jgi:glyoxylase-like metal-dependent hydrolase (beta-lactamase superfamily II)
MTQAARASAVSVALALAFWAQGIAQSVPPIVQAVSEAIGVSKLQSIQYSGSGSAFAIGQAASPGGPWPRFELAKYVVTVDYSGAIAMREEMVRRDVEFPPRGGGAGPFIAATGQGGMRPIPGDVVQTLVRDGRSEAGRLQIAMTPHGFLKLAATNPVVVTPVRVEGRTLQALNMAIGSRTITAHVNDDRLIERIVTAVPNPVLGEMTVETIFADYRDYAGVRFPTRMVQRQAGQPTLDVTVADVRPNGASPITLPAAPPQGPAPQPVTTELDQIAAGVYFLTGGAPWSILVEFADHVIVIEAPQDEARSSATIAAVTRAIPGKPIRFLVNTHHHFDHSGGLRGYIEQGIPIVTHERNRPYFQRIFQGMTPAPVIETVSDKRVFSDRTMSLELHHLAGNFHAETLLVAYLPKQKLLIQADAFHPRPGAAPLASPPPFTVNLVENIRRLKLDVDRVVHVHGGTDTLATVVTAAGG